MADRGVIMQQAKICCAGPPDCCDLFLPARSGPALACAAAVALSCCLSPWKSTDDRSSMSLLCCGLGLLACMVSGRHAFEACC